MGFISDRLIKMYRDILFVRHDPDGRIFYFSHEDFDGLHKTPFEFKSRKGHTLKGGFYYYDNPRQDRLIVLDHGLGVGHRGYMREIETICRKGYMVFTYLRMKYLLRESVKRGEGVYENFITQQAYVGLQPSVEGENKYLLEWYSGDDYLSIRNNCYDLLQPFSLQNIRLSIRNWSGSDSNYYGDYVAAIMNEARELKTFISEEQQLVGGFINGEIENCIIKERPDVGDYIAILFRSKGYDEWEEVLTHSYSDNARVYLNESESLEDNTSIVINPNEELFKSGYVELMTKLLTIKTMSGTSLKIYRSDGTMVEYDEGAKPLRIVKDVDFSSLIHYIFLSNLEPGTYTIVLQHSLQKKEIIIII